MITLSSTNNDISQLNTMYVEVEVKHLCREQYNHDDLILATYYRRYAEKYLLKMLRRNLPIFVDISILQ